MKALQMLTHLLDCMNNKKILVDLHFGMKLLPRCITLISIPMNEIVLNYYKRNGYQKWVERTEKEAFEIQKRLRYHLNKAEVAWNKSTTSENLITTERKKIAKFISTWLPYYPIRFYEYGLYPTYFRELREIAENENNIKEILLLEAHAAEICAALYEKIPIANGLKEFVEIRNNYLKHATLLRTLSEKTHKILPDEANHGKHLNLKHSSFRTSSQNNSDTILQTAKSDSRIKSLLQGQKNYHEYTWFQGFAWTVSFYNHNLGNLAIVIIDDQTGKVIDILKGDGHTE